MKRSQIIAARARNAQSGVGAGGAPHQPPSAIGPAAGGGSSLPPFTSKSAASSATAAAAATTPTLTMPKWNGDLSKKNTLREERNARARQDTQERRARREGRAPGGAALTADEEAIARELDEAEDDAMMAAAAEAAEADAAAPPLGLSDAKRAFLAAAKPGTIHSSAAAAAASESTSAPPAPTPAAAPLPSFSPVKRAFPGAVPRTGSGITPRQSIAPTKVNTAAEKPERYFACNFCARSNKKHKNYDDGVLIVCGRRCTLKNMSAQTIGSSLVSQSTDKFELGGVYFIGSHEVELGAPIADAEYLSGRVFVGTTYAMKLGEPSASAPSSDAKRQKTGNALFSKQRVANKQPAAPFDPTAILNDPALMVLNRDGIIHRAEKAVIVDLFLSKQLRDHQREGVQFMYDCIMGIRSQGYEGCILADEMGLGKTLQSITVAWTLLNSNPAGKKGGVVSKVIIVCPATLVNNWNKEFVKWLGSHRCKPLVLMASLPQVDQKQMVQDFILGLVSNVLIVGYELFRKHVKELKKVPSPLLICDEGHRLKSTTANQTITSLLAIPTRRRIMLTGTPVQNDLGEFFAMCDFVNPSILGNLATFSRTFMQPINRSRDTSASVRDKQLGEARSAELAARTQNFVLRRSNEVLLQYLPEKIEQVLFIPLTPMQAEIYRGLLRGKAIRQVLARTAACGNDAVALKAIGSLKKVCNHPGLTYEDAREFSGTNEPKSVYSFYPANYVPQSNYADVTQSSKLAVLDHLLSAVKREGGRIVVVSNYIQTLDMLATYLQSRKYQYLRLDGQTPASERIALVDRFNAPYASEAFVFLLSAKAGGVGLNLIGGSRLVLFDPDWNPATDAQAAARVWRDGQKSTVYIYRFLCTATIDEKIYQRQIRKQELSLSVMQGNADAEVMRNFDNKSLKEIFTYNDVTNSETRDVLLRTKKKSGYTDDDMQTMGDFHESLENALDPVLQTLPSHLVSAFLNRVSSQEENRRLLELLANMQKRAHERDLAKEEKKADANSDADSTVDEDNFIDDDADFDFTGGGNKQKEATPARSAATAMEHDFDDGEAEAEFLPSAAVSSSAAAASSAPCSLSSVQGAPPSPFAIISAEDEEAAAEAEAEDREFVIVPKRKKRRRSIVDDEEDETPVAPEPEHDDIGVSDGSLPEWMRPHDTAVPSHAAPHRSGSSAALDSAAMSIAPPDDAPEDVEMEYTLDTIGGGAKPSIKFNLHQADDDDE